jgi:putative transposase
MRLMGIEAIYPKPNTSKPIPWNKRFPYLLRSLKIDQMNQVWSTDITYIPMENGYMYLCAILDWYSKYVLSWQLSNSMDVSFCLDCLDEAIDHYGSAQIINTDQGSQFTSDVFI